MPPSIGTDKQAEGGQQEGPPPGAVWLNMAVARVKKARVTIKRIFLIPIP